MGKISNRIIAFFMERRKKSVPVSHERRSANNRMRDADKRLSESIDKLDRTVRLRREDFIRRTVANDIQTVTIFSTFSDICTWKVPNLSVRMCRHPQHEAANTGVAKCDEHLCPFMLGKVAKSAA